MDEKEHPADPQVEQNGTEEEGEANRIPGWVYLVILLVLVAILLGVEAVLDWLLPSR